MNPLIDSHCHFDFAPFSAANIEVAKAQQAGVTKILVPAIGQSNWLQVAQLSQRYPHYLYHALGLHPYFIEQHNDDALSVLNQVLDVRHTHCVAIGECGLDMMLAQELLTPALLAKQQSLFCGQIELAQQYGLPLIIHNRKAHQQIIKLLRQYRPSSGGVIHAFSGSFQQAMEYIELGFYIGVGGVITYPRALKTRKTISQLPLEYLLLETDAPDMPLYGKQGQTNHPANLPYVAQALLELRSEDENQLYGQLIDNSQRLFKFDEII